MTGKTNELRKAARADFSAESRASVLIVDDDERNLLAITEVLSGLARIVTATSGRDALRLLLKEEFAVILLDVYMPGLDGYETAKLIRERRQTSRIPIIFLSAVNKELEHLMRGYEMGAVDYVFKPVDPVMLKSKVSVFVDLQEMRLLVEERSRAEQVLRLERDIAERERRKARRDLGISEQRQAAILEALPVALYEERIGGNGGPGRKFVGGDVQALTGFDPLDLAGDERLFLSRVHPDDRDRVLAECTNPAAASSLEYRWMSPDETLHHFLDQRAQLANAIGEPVIVGTLMDVTAQKALENQVLQSGKLEAIGQLTGGIAHDFNNLLASILGGIQLISSRSQLSERESRIIELMRHAADQGVQLVRRMMAFARKQELLPSQFSAADLASTVGGLVEHALGGMIRLVQTCEEDEMFLFADRAQLELALVNLIINARDAMPVGGEITVQIRAESFAGDRPELGLEQGDYVLVAVTDTGEGMPAEMIARAVEPFFTTKEVGSGTGLGLAMVSGFVRQSGGAMRIQSEVGRGTCVELWMPRYAFAPEQVDEPDAQDEQISQSRVRKILLVDDDDNVRAVLTEQLLDKQIEVTAVSSAQLAIDQLRNGANDFDLMLTDFAMPGMNGLELISEVRSIAPELRVLLMTGYASGGTLSLDEQQIPVLRKPISDKSLLEELVR